MAHSEGLSASRAPHRAAVAKATSIIRGIKPLKQYVGPGQYLCFSKSAAAVKRGYTFYKNNKPPKAKKGEKCSFLAIVGTVDYVSYRELISFRNEAAALKRGYTKFQLPVASSGGATPTPIPGTATPLPDKDTPLPGSTPVPTATSTPEATPVAGSTITLHATLIPHDPAATDLTGSCEATISATHTVMTLDCTHNVQDAGELHIHAIPKDVSFCHVVPPTSPIHIVCTIAPEDADTIIAGAQRDAGGGLIVIHKTAGSNANQILLGYLR